jgi:hypothetical protein
MGACKHPSIRSRRHRHRAPGTASPPALPTTRTVGPVPRAAGQHARQDSNLQPPVLETGALPIELRAYISGQGQNRTADTMIFSHVLYQLSYLASTLRAATRRDEKPALLGAARAAERARCAAALRPARRSRPGVHIAFISSTAHLERRRHELIPVGGCGPLRRPTRQAGRPGRPAVVAGAGFEPATSGL